MKNTKSPLSEEMDHIEGDNNINDNSQEIDLDNPGVFQGSCHHQAKLSGL